MFTSPAWDNPRLERVIITTIDFACDTYKHGNGNGCLVASQLEANAAAIQAEYADLYAVLKARFGTRPIQCIIDKRRPERSSAIPVWPIESRHSKIGQPTRDGRAHYARLIAAYSAASTRRCFQNRIDFIFARVVGRSLQQHLDREHGANQASSRRSIGK